MCVNVYMTSQYIYMYIMPHIYRPHVYIWPCAQAHYYYIQRITSVIEQVVLTFLSAGQGNSMGISTHQGQVE